MLAVLWQGELMAEPGAVVEVVGFSEDLHQNRTGDIIAQNAAWQ